MKLLLAAALLMQDKTAEEVLKKIEDTLAQAKTFSCIYSWTGDVPLDHSQLFLRHSGGVYVKDQDKYALWVEVGSAEWCCMNPHSALFSRPSDGTKEFVRPTNMRAVVAANFVRGGGCLGLLPIKKGKNKQGEEVNLMEIIKITDLVREPDSGASGALTFNLTIVDKAAPATITLWYDLKSYLPLRRKLEYIHNDDLSRLTEVYREWTFNDDIPDEKFKLPEEKK
jgi:hypothetical protein